MSERSKTLARARAQRALAAGIIERRPCEVCGAKAEMHHPDYREPLHVVWLCHKHHAAVHGLSLTERPDLLAPVAEILRKKHIVRARGLAGMFHDAHEESTECKIMRWLEGVARETAS